MYMNAVAWPSEESVCVQEHSTNWRLWRKLGNRTLEPPRLHTNSTTLQWPRRAICARTHTAAGIHPLHAIWKRVICDQVVSSPSRVGNDCVCGGDAEEGEGGEE